MNYTRGEGGYLLGERKRVITSENEVRGRVQVGG